MTARFAGSHCLDDRRRRRLAQESNDDEAAPLDRDASKAGDSVTGGDSVEASCLAEEPEPVPLPDESLIPRSPWKIALISLLLFGLGSGSLWLGHSEFSRIPGFEPILNLENGRLPRFFGTLTLLLAAELSFVILWYRARSRKDFSGRYRLWGWAGCFFGIMCLSATTGLHVPLAEILLARWPVECWRAETVFWLTPMAIGFLAVSHLLLLEMRHARWSRMFWIITFWWGLLTAGMQLGLEMFVPEPVRITVTTGMTLFWQFLITLTLLTHARFVVHVTNEPAPREPGWLRRMWGLLYAGASTLAARRQDRRAARNEKRKKQITESRPKGDSSGSSPAGNRSRSRGKDRSPSDSGKSKTKTGRRVLGKSIRVDAAQSSPRPHVLPEEPAERAAGDCVGEAESGESQQQRRLSKKERRRLRKERQNAPSTPSAE
jgi:hypothetical protein